MKNNWKPIKLGEVLKLEYGKPLSDDKRNPNGKYPVYGANGEKNRTDEFYYNKPSIIVGRKGSAGEVNFTEDKFWALDVTYFVTFDEKKYDLKFLYNALLTLELTKLAKGVKPGINRNDVYALDVTIPPLAEQQRIVAILDEAFAAIAQAKENAEKNLQNARELFDSYLQSVFANPGDGWEELDLSTLLEKGWIVSHLDGNHGGEYPRKEEFVKEGIPYISANCLKGNYVDISLSKYLSPERAASIRKGIAKNNDVLFAHNATVGPVALLKTDEEKIILGTSLTYYRCNTEFILPEYLTHYMRSNNFKSQYELVMRQSTRNQVPITKQREFFHIIPPVQTQKQLVIKLDVLLTETEKLESIYRQKINDLDELKKSILQKAFNGELK